MNSFPWGDKNRGNYCSAGGSEWAEAATLGCQGTANWGQLLCMASPTLFKSTAMWTKLPFDTSQDALRLQKTVWTRISLARKWTAGLVSPELECLQLHYQSITQLCMTWGGNMAEHNWKLPSQFWEHRVRCYRAFLKKFLKVVFLLYS